MSRRWDDFRARPAAVEIIVTAVAALVVIIGVLVGEPTITSDDTLTIDAPVYATAAPVQVEVPANTAPTVRAATPTSSPDVAAAGTSTSPTEYAELADTQVIRSAPIPGTTLPIVGPTPGDCDAWAEVFRSYGATATEVAFFVPRIIDRESGCGRDTLNERTGDTGVCQVNPVHNRAGYFGQVQYGPGGWLLELHGLTTRVDTANPAWASACLTLFRVCGSGPWRPPYSCDNRRLPS